MLRIITLTAVCQASTEDSNVMSNTIGASKLNEFLDKSGDDCLDRLNDLKIVGGIDLKLQIEYLKALEIVCPDLEDFIASKAADTTVPPAPTTAPSTEPQTTSSTPETTTETPQLSTTTTQEPSSIPTTVEIISTTTTSTTTTSTTTTMTTATTTTTSTTVRTTMPERPKKLTNIGSGSNLYKKAVLKAVTKNIRGAEVVDTPAPPKRMEQKFRNRPNKSDTYADVTSTKSSSAFNVLAINQSIWLVIGMMILI